jgi:hypothetical protein
MTHFWYKAKSGKRESRSPEKLRDFAQPRVLHSLVCCMIAMPTIELGNPLNPYQDEFISASIIIQEQVKRVGLR